MPLPALRTLRIPVPDIQVLEALDQPLHIAIRAHVTAESVDLGQRWALWECEADGRRVVLVRAVVAEEICFCAARW